MTWICGWITTRTAPTRKAACGEYSSVSTVDNVEYVVVDNPPAGTYRLKVVPFNAPGFSLPYGMAATIIRGDPTPPVTAFMTTTPSNPTVGSTFGVTVNVSTPSYVASGVQVEPAPLPLGVTPLYVETMRLDGVTMSFPDAPRRPDARQRRPHAEPIGDLVLPGGFARSQDLHGTRVVGERGRVPREHDGRRRARHA